MFGESKAPGPTAWWSWPAAKPRNNRDLTLKSVKERERFHLQLLSQPLNGLQAEISQAALDVARDLIRARKDAQNVLRYLMLEMNNRILKLQYDPEGSGLLSGLRLTSSAKQFDVMPFCTSLRGHNPRFWDLEVKTVCLIVVYIGLPGRNAAAVLTLKGTSYRLRGRGIDSLPSIKTQEPAN